MRTVSRGERWVDRPPIKRAFGRMLKQEAASKEAAKTFTPRELEVVRLIANGHRNRSISDRLCISEGTVKIHLHNVYQKIGVNGRLELVLWAGPRTRLSVGWLHRTAYEICRSSDSRRRLVGGRSPRQRS